MPAYSMNHWAHFAHMFVDMLLPPERETLLVRQLPAEALSARVRTGGETNADLAVLPYKDLVVRDVVHALKFQGARHGATLLAHALAPHLAESLAECRMFGTFDEPLVVLVPLSKQRRRERGYDQTLLLAQVLVQLFEPPLHVCMTLQRQRDTKPQSHLKDAKERKENVTNAFVVREPLSVKGKDVVLLDDVVTTGATLSSARATLRKAGARNVMCVAAVWSRDSAR